MTVQVIPFNARDHYLIGATVTIYKFDRAIPEIASADTGPNPEFADKLYFRDEDFDVLDALLEVAEARHLPPARVALAWLLSRPGVVAPIIGATKLPHLEDAAAALEVRLSDDEVAKLEAPYEPHPVRGHEPPTARDVGTM